MRAKDASPEATSIRQTVASSTTCTTTTVAELKQLLLPECSSRLVTPVKSSLGKNQPKVHPLGLPKDSRTRARKLPEVASHEPSEVNSVRTSKTDRQRLATEIVNAVLKALTEAVKSQHPSSDSPSPKRESRLQDALQPISVNTVVSQRKTVRSARQSRCSSATEGHPGLLAQAECAILALATLRATSTDKASEKRLPPFQIENAMSTLISKCIALGLFEPALKELRTLKKLLLLASGESIKGSSIPPADSACRESVMDLLVLPSSRLAGPLLAIAVTFQLQVVKLIVAKRDLSSFRATIDHLSLQAPHSPAKLIEAQYNPEDPLSGKRVASQLESLAQMIFALCPSTSSLEDHQSSLVQFMDPLTAFRFQVLALKVRSMSWKIAEHKADFRGDFLEPFSRYLGAFRRRCSAGVEDGYQLARNLLSDLTSWSQTTGEISSSETWRRIYLDLAELIRDSPLNKETITWIEDYVKLPAGVTTSPCRVAVRKCEVAAMYTQLSGDPLAEGQKIKALEIAERHINGNLDGESEDLDELLLAVSRLRKTAGYVINKFRARPEAPSGQKLVQKCSCICLISVRFLHRYIGSKPGQDPKMERIHRYRQRVKQASAVAAAFIESVIMVAKLSKAAASDEWFRIEAALGDCLSLANAIEGACPAAAKEGCTIEAIGSLCLPISNAFWSRYVQLKQSDTDPVGRLKALNGSIDAVQHRSLHDRLAAQLPTRLEHLSRSFETAREYQKAAEGYMRAIKMHIKAGIVRKAAAAAATKPLVMVFARDSEFASLGRVLAAYPRLSTRIEAMMRPEDTVFDDEQLESSQLGMVLEHQLASLISLPQSDTNGLRTIAAIRFLARRLFNVYSEQSFPIRRLRTAETLSWLHIMRPEALTLEATEKIRSVKEILVSGGLHGLDSSLQLTLPHLNASRYAVFAIQEHCPAFKQQQLKNALAIWYPLLEQCSELESIEARVGDACVWLQHLELLAQYLKVYGLDQHRLSVLHLSSTAREKWFPTHHEALALDLAQSGLLHLQIGCPNQAGVIFQKTQKYVNEAKATAKTALICNVAYARYFLATGNISKCEEKLAHAQTVFQEHDQIGQPVFDHDRNMSLRILADAAATCSDLAARRGNHYQALLSAHQGLKLAQQAWTNIEKRQKKDRLNSADHYGNGEMSVLADSMAKATFIDSRSDGEGSKSLSEASIFWCLVPQLHNAFLQLGQIYSDGGMFKEAKYYIERSMKLAEGASASGLLIQSLNRLANIQAHGNDYVGAHEKFESAQRLLSPLDRDMRFVEFQVDLATYHLARGQTLAADEAHDIADATLQHLSAERSIDQSLHRQPDVQAIQEGMSDLSIGTLTLHPPPNKRRVPAKRPRARAIQSGKCAKTTPESSQDPEAISAMLQLKCHLLRQRARLALQQGKLEQASEHLAAALNQYCTSHETTIHAILSAEISIKRGLNAISSDPVFCVLSESTVSLPAVLPSGPLPSSDVRDAPKIATGKRTNKRGTVLAKGRRMQVAPQANGDELCGDFRQAHTESCKVLQLAKSFCPTSSLHRLSKVLAESLVRLSALNLAFPQPALQSGPKFLLQVAEAARAVSMQRGKSGILAEKGQAAERGLLTWPADMAADSKTSNPVDIVPVSGFDREQDVGAIPNTWQILSISLSQSYGEILVSRIRAGQTPFILSLPLDRHSSREPGEESFGYRQAKAELEEILALADQSTHATPDPSRKGARAEWWERRALLDARLKDLLTNIGSVWFGGFQGVFSQMTASPELLARFQQSLNVALDHHLPSRQGSSKQHMSQQTSLDSRVVELFVALGDPAELPEMEEPLMDLLYFVTDILQFHGERNAYDEIDFDSMAIEIIDALRQYHEAAKKISNGSAIQHTILVLDKELHRFPWESLPCLDGQAVTRLPSLCCLRERMAEVHNAGHANAVDEWRCTVDPRKGAFVLNPAGDLRATQARFEEPLNKLTGWEGLIGSEPNEAQLKGYLQAQDIFLYFGHGSGGQYIRSKTVQKLDRCAVALLIGCSSGRMTEAGEFEPYGTPMSYMQAGSCAMLATLWDVTDKDIDRFSETVLQKWGLFEDQSCSNRSPVKKGARTKGRSKTRAMRVSLDQAVAQGRGSCIFRYLNGAAAVVYGIPVFLA
ncbi:MAG: hypothetical protein L6R37_003388 [Teloschistes peruensis]|nr:MAG: hypothetical protein L6R37_003388 [Teloschistes peruensis]